MFYQNSLLIRFGPVWGALFQTTKCVRKRVLLLIRMSRLNSEADTANNESPHFADGDAGLAVRDIGLI